MNVYIQQNNLQLIISKEVKTVYNTDSIMIHNLATGKYEKMIISEQDILYEIGTNGPCFIELLILKGEDYIPLERLCFDPHNSKKLSIPVNPPKPVDKIVEKVIEPAQTVKRIRKKLIQKNINDYVGEMKKRMMEEMSDVIKE